MTILYVLNTYILYIHTTCYIYCIHYGVADVCANKQNPPPPQDILWSFCGAGLMRTTDITRPTAYESTRIHKVCRAGRVLCWLLNLCCTYSPQLAFPPRLAAFGGFAHSCPLLALLSCFFPSLASNGHFWPLFRFFPPPLAIIAPLFLEFFGIFSHFLAVLGCFWPLLGASVAASGCSGCLLATFASG